MSNNSRSTENTLIVLILAINRDNREKSIQDVFHTLFCFYFCIFSKEKHKVYLEAEVSI